MLKSRSIWYLAFTAIIIAIADQWTKMLVVSNMRLHETILLPVDFVQLTYIRNKGGAFGVFQDQMLFFIIAGVLTIGFVLRYMAEIYDSSRVSAYTCACIMGGAIGNMIDRVRLGYVVDFIDLKWWPVFNVADIAITCGVAVLIWMLCFGKELHDGKEQAVSAGDGNGEGASGAAQADLGAEQPKPITLQAEQAEPGMAQADLDKAQAEHTGDSHAEPEAAHNEPLAAPSAEEIASSEKNGEFAEQSE